MAAKKAKQKIPTSNNLFDIMLDMTTSAVDLYNVIVKNKLNANTFAKTMNKYIDNMTIILNKMNEKFTELASRDWSTVSKLNLSPIVSLIDDVRNMCESLTKLKPVNYLQAALKLFHVYNLVEIYIGFAKRVADSTVGKDIILMQAQIVLHTIAESTESMKEITENLKGINFIILWRASRGMNRMYKLLFGDIVKQRRGLVDILLGLTGKVPVGKSGQFFSTKDATLAMVCVKMLTSALKSLISTLALLALATPVLPIAWLGMWLLSEIVKLIVRTFGMLGKAKTRKNVAMGSLVLMAVTASMLLFVASMILIGIAIIQGWQAITLGMLGMALCILGIYAILQFLTKRAVQIGEGALILLAICAVMLLAALSILMLSQVPFTDMLLSIGGFALVIGILVGICMLLGLLAETGIFVIGLAMLMLLAVVMLAVSVSFMIIAITLNMLATMEIPDDVLIKLFKPIGVLLQYMMDNIAIFNPATLYLLLMNAALCMAIIIMTTIMTLGLALIRVIVKKWKEEENRDMLVKVYSPVISLLQYMWDNKKIFNPFTLGLALANVALTLPIVLITTVIALLTWAVYGITKQMDWKLAETNIKSLFDVYVGKEGIIHQLDEISAFDILKAAAKFELLIPMVASVGLMASVISKVAKLQIPDEYNKDGKPVHFHTITAGEFKQAAVNVATMTEFFVKVICGGTTADGTTYEGCLKDIEQVKRKHKKGMRRLADIVGSVGNMADTISKFATMTVPDEAKGWDEENGRWKSWRVMKSTDFIDAAKNIEYVANFFVDTICGKGGEEGIAKKVYDKFEQFKKTEVFGSFKNIIDIVVGMGESIDKFANMMMPDPNSEYDPETGRWKKYKPMDDFGPATENIRIVMTTLIEALADDGFIANLKKLDKKVRNNLDGVFDSVKSFVDVIGTTVELYSKAGDVKEPDKMAKRILSMVNGITVPITNWKLDATSKNKVMYLNAITDNIEKLNGSFSNVENVERGMKAYGEFFKVIDKSKLNNLKYAYSLLRAMEGITKNMRGNFDKLAETLNEDIIEQLKKIAELLSDINESGGTPRVSTGGSTFGSVASVIGGASTKTESTSTDKTPEKTKQKTYTAEELQKILGDIRLTLTNITADGPQGYLRLNGR